MPPAKTQGCFTQLRPPHKTTTLPVPTSPFVQMADIERVVHTVTRVDTRMMPRESTKRKTHLHEWAQEPGWAYSPIPA